MTALDRLHQAEAELRVMCDHVPDLYSQQYWQDRVEVLLAALDAARGEAVAWQARLKIAGCERWTDWGEVDDVEHFKRFHSERGNAFEVRELFAAPPAALAVPADRYTVDAVAWEGFIKDWYRYVGGDPKMPFVQIREGLVAVIDSAQKAQQPAAAVPAERLPVGGSQWGWAGEYNRGWNDCRAAMLAAANKENTNG